MPWASKHHQCSNCGTTRFPHKGKGLCHRCYRLSKKMDNVNAWNYNDRSTWHELPDSSKIMITDNSLFEKIRQGYLSQIQLRLDQLRYWEENRNGQIDSLTLETELRHLAKESGARNGWSIHSHYANTLADKFSPEQQQEIYILLNDIRQAKPWKGINWYRIFYDD